MVRSDRLMLECITKSHCGIIPVEIMQEIMILITYVSYLNDTPNVRYVELNVRKDSSSLM